MADNPCLVELEAADLCVQASADDCSCFEQPFYTTFPAAVESSYVDILAAQDPANPEFCNLVNEDICGFLEASASCCCQQETIEYNVCIFAKHIVTKYDVFQDASCTDGGSCVVDTTADEGGFDPTNPDDFMIYGIIATIIGLILSVLYYCFCYRRRRVTIKNKGGNNKGIEVNVVCKGQKTTNTREEYTHNTTENKTAEIHQHHQRTTKREEPVTWEGSGSESLEDDFDWGKFNETEHTRGDIESARSNRTEITSERSSRKTIKRTEELKEKRRNIENWHEDEKKKRKSSRKVLEICDDDGDDDSESSSTRRRKRKDKKKKKRERRERERERKEREPAVEETMRQARTVMEEVEDERDQRKILALMPNLREIIELLEEEKRYLWDKSKEVEEEKLRLKMEIKNSKREMRALESSTAEAKQRLVRTELGREVVETGVKKDLSKIEQKKKEAYKDLKKIKEETDGMTQLLEMLKQAEEEAQAEANRSEDDALRLKMEKTHSQKDLALLEISRVEEEKQIVKAGLRNAELLNQVNAQEESSSDRGGVFDDLSSLEEGGGRSHAMGSNQGMMASSIQERESNVISLDKGNDRKDLDKDLLIQRLEQLKSQNKDLESQLLDANDGQTEVSSLEDPPFATPCSISRSTSVSRSSSQNSFIPMPSFMDENCSLSSDERSCETHLYGDDPPCDTRVGGTPPDSPGFGLYCNIEF